MCSERNLPVSQVFGHLWHIKTYGTAVVLNRYTSQLPTPTPTDLQTVKTGSSNPKS